MQRDYKDQTDVSGVKAFIGKEIERTHAYGLHTLFLDPSHLSNDEMIILIAETEGIEHVYLNANHYPIEDDLVFARYLDVLLYCESNTKIKAVTIEIQKPDKLEKFLPILDRFNKILFNVSIKIPHVESYAHRIAIKIDDSDFKATNPGVWCHLVDDLIYHAEHAFTPWDHYKNDKVIK